MMNIRTKETEVGICLSCGYVARFQNFDNRYVKINAFRTEYDLSCPECNSDILDYAYDCAGCGDYFPANEAYLIDDKDCLCPSCYDAVFGWKENI